MKIFTSERECGNIIECFESIEEAMKAIKSYEEEDRKNGDYTPDFYDIVDENNCSLEFTPEMIFLETLESIRQIKIDLMSKLAFVYVYSPPTNKNADSPEYFKKLAIYKSEYEELSMLLKDYLKLGCEKIYKWRQTCTLSEMERIQKYIYSLKVLNHELKYFDEKYNEII